MGHIGRKQGFLVKVLQIFHNSLLPLPSEYRHLCVVVTGEDFHALCECPFVLTAGRDYATLP